MYCTVDVALLFHHCLANCISGVELCQLMISNAYSTEAIHIKGNQQPVNRLLER